MNNPKELKTINLSDFTKGIINLREGRKVAFYHREYIEGRSKLLTNNTFPDFTYNLDDPRMILADYYYKNKLTDNYDDVVVEEDEDDDIEKIIENYQAEIENNPNNNLIAWSYFNLADCFLKIKDFERAKDCFLKSAKQDSILSADSYFALSCIKIRLNENAEVELKRSFEGYEQQQNEYVDYIRSILECPIINYQVMETFILSGKKIESQIIGNIGEGYYSPAQIDIAFKAIISFMKRELKYAQLPQRLSGNFKIEVAFIDELPYIYVSHFEISGFIYKELEDIINKMYKTSKC